MPRFPQTSPGTGGIYQSMFAHVAQALAAVDGEVYPLHIGDTYVDPVDWGSFGPEAKAEGNRLARYAHPYGRPDLLDVVRTRLAAAGLDADEDRVLITSGATHALFCAALTVLAPGDEVLLCAPYWPLIPGILRAAGVVPVEVPFFDRLEQGSAKGIGALLSEHITARTAAVYFNSPNNPSGTVLDELQLCALAEVAQGQGLWVLADEVYAGFAFGEQPPLCASLPGMGARTLSAFSLSKSFALAGYRVGYVHGPPELVTTMRKVSTHTVYSVSGMGQFLAKRLLEDGDGLERRIRDAYRAGARVVAEGLRARFRPAAGGAYVFLDLSPYRDPVALLDAALARGVALAPGGAFGSSYARWARLCYTAVPPEALNRAVAIFNEVLDGAAR